MTITFEDNKDVIVYALEKIITFARSNQYIFLAQSVCWISSIIGHQEGLITYIDNLKVREQIGRPELRMQSVIPLKSSGIHPERIMNIQNYNHDYCTSVGKSVSTSETDIYNDVIENCELFLERPNRKEKLLGARLDRLTERLKRGRIMSERGKHR
jgi:hypothetical protein